MLGSAIALLLAQVATPADIPKKALYTADGEKVECRLTWEIISRIPTRVCRTVNEWERLAKENQDDWRSSRNSRTIGCNQINCM
jgi:hypothetical protein